MVGIRKVGESNLVDWIGGTNGPLSDYGIVFRTNLLIGNWTAIGARPRVQGTNTWGQASTGNPGEFYRVTATN